MTQYGPYDTYAHGRVYHQNGHIPSGYQDLNGDGIPDSPNARYYVYRDTLTGAKFPAFGDPAGQYYLDIEGVYTPIGYGYLYYEDMFGGGAVWYGEIDSEKLENNEYYYDTKGYFHKKGYGFVWDYDEVGIGFWNYGIISEIAEKNNRHYIDLDGDAVFTEKPEALSRSDFISLFHQDQSPVISMFPPSLIFQQKLYFDGKSIPVDFAYQSYLKEYEKHDSLVKSENIIEMVRKLTETLDTEQQEEIEMQINGIEPRLFKRDLEYMEKETPDIKQKSSIKKPIERNSDLQKEAILENNVVKGKVVSTPDHKSLEKLLELEENSTPMSRPANSPDPLSSESRGSSFQSEEGVVKGKVVSTPDHKSLEKLLELEENSTPMSRPANSPDPLSSESRGSSFQSEEGVVKGKVVSTPDHKSLEKLLELEENSTPMSRPANSPDPLSSESRGSSFQSEEGVVKGKVVSTPDHKSLEKLLELEENSTPMSRPANSPDPLSSESRGSSFQSEEGVVKGKVVSTPDHKSLEKLLELEENSTPMSRPANSPDPLSSESKGSTFPLEKGIMKGIFKDEEISIPDGNSLEQLSEPEEGFGFNNSSSNYFNQGSPESQDSLFQQVENAERPTGRTLASHSKPGGYAVRQPADQRGLLEEIQDHPIFKKMVEVNKDTDSIGQRGLLEEIQDSPIFKRIAEAGQDFDENGLSDNIFQLDDFLSELDLPETDNPNYMPFINELEGIEADSGVSNLMENILGGTTEAEMTGNVLLGLASIGL